VSVKFYKLAVSRVSLLDFQAYNSIFIFIIVYILSQSIMGLTWFCDANVKLDYWVNMINLAAITLHLINIAVQVMFILIIILRNDLSGSRQATSRLKIHATLSSISIIACSSQALTFFYNYSGVCKDLLG
jgi:hypothetical protein